MLFVSVTRLRLRSLRFVPAFGLHAMRSLDQCRRAPGFQDGALLRDRAWTFWTMTRWQDGAAMRAYMASGPHLKAMPKLMAWCDEASVVHWTHADTALPGWPEADRRMRSQGRPSKVRQPSPLHHGLSFPEPKLGRVTLFRRATRAV